MTHRTTLRVAQVSFHFDAQLSPSQIFEHWWPLVDCAEMVAQAGAQVHVLQSCSQRQTITRNDVVYHFMPPAADGVLAHAPEFSRLLAQADADVLHVHGFAQPHQVVALAACNAGRPVLLQDHANGVPRWWGRRALRRAFAQADAVSFCAADQALPFRRAGLITPRTAVWEIPECSSRFTPGDQAAARVSVGMHGDPALLWVGHLNRNKDPLTVLAALAPVAKRYPGLQLWCCYGSAPLLREVQRQADALEPLRGRVHLVGRVAHQRVQDYMRAADLFVTGSHREGSGVAAIEALACGLPTVVTDIPSFRALVGDDVGARWAAGDAGALTRALLGMLDRNPRQLRTAVRAHFDAHLSFAAVGHALVRAYQSLLDARTSASAADPGMPA